MHLARFVSCFSSAALPGRRRDLDVNAQVVRTMASVRELVGLLVTMLQCRNLRWAQSVVKKDAVRSLRSYGDTTAYYHLHCGLVECPADARVERTRRQPAPTK